MLVIFVSVLIVTYSTWESIRGLLRHFTIIIDRFIHAEYSSLLLTDSIIEGEKVFTSDFYSFFKRANGNTYFGSFFVRCK